MTHRPDRTWTVGRWVALLVVVPAIVLLGAVPAFAHTELELSSPASGAVLETPPTTVRLVFNESVSTRLASVVVVGPDGANYAQGVPTVAGAVVVQRLKPLPVAGSYRVGYRVVSDDGHPVTGSLSFTVSSVAEPAVAAVSVPSPSLAPAAVAVREDASRYAAPFLAGAAVAVVATGLVLATVAVTRARRRTDPARVPVDGRAR